MFCIECGAKSQEGSKYCIICGSKLYIPNENKAGMSCKNCGENIPENNTFCPFCLSQVELLNNNPQKVDSKYAKEFVGSQTLNNDEIEKKVDELINDINKKQNNDFGFEFKIHEEQNDNVLSRKSTIFVNNIVKKCKNKEFINKIQCLMKELHDYIIYDEQLKNFVETDIYKKNDILHDFYNNYKNSPDEVIKNKKGTCVGYSNTFKLLCEMSGIKCQILEYHIHQKNFHHSLNIVFNNEEKYYVDCTWGFITDDFNEVKVNYQSGRTETSQYFYNKIEAENSGDTKFMTIMFLSIPALIIILLFIKWLIQRY